MSNFDRNAYGQQGFARADGMAIDQGLRAYMLGIYNHMVLGLAITALTVVYTTPVSFGAAKAVHTEVVAPN